jgi:hypothetical protein
MKAVLRPVQSLVRLIDRTSRRFSIFAGVFGAAAALLVGMLQIGPHFQRVTHGFEPFDFQDTLSVAQIEAQIPHYTAASKTLYWWIAALDWPFPFLAGLVWAAIAAWSLRRLWPAAYAAGRCGWMLPLFMVGAICDFAENLANLRLVAAAPALDATAAQLSVLAKQGKTIGVAGAMTVALTLTVVAVAVTAIRQRAARRET